MHRRRRWTQLLTEVADELRDWQRAHTRLGAELTNRASSADFFPPHGEAEDDEASAAVAPPPPLLPPQAPAVLQRAAAYVLGGTSLGASLAAASRGAPGTAPAPRARPCAAGVPRGSAALPVAAEVSESRCSPEEAAECADSNPDPTPNRNRNPNPTNPDPNPN